MVLFRERHSFDEEQTAWELWHMRQHSFKQRVIDVGMCWTAVVTCSDRTAADDVVQ